MRCVRWPMYRPAPMTGLTSCHRPSLWKERQRSPALSRQRRHLLSRPPTIYVDFFRVRIDPLKSDQTDKFVRFRFSDGTTAGLHVRRAVAEFVLDPDEYYRKPDFTLAMTGETWVKVYLSQAMPEDLIKNGEIKVTGDANPAAIRTRDPQLRRLVLYPAELPGQ